MTSIDGPWSLAQSPPSHWDAPSTITAADWLPAIVPGTVGAALLAANRWQPDDNLGFDAFDFWYRTELGGAGPTILRFEGLATIAEVFLDDVPILQSQSMFVAHEVTVELAGTHRLHICFRSLDAYLATQKGRARWRPRLVRPPSLRFVRTLLLGHIPGWGPPVHAIGPWRAVKRIDAAALRIVEQDIRTTFADGDGEIALAIKLSAPTSGWVVASIGAIDFTLVEDGAGWLRGRITVPDAEAWWPHTHGTPALYPLRLFVGNQTFNLGPVGFRSVVVDRDADGRGFGLVVNGVPVFCRGACWSSADIVALPFDREAYAPLLTLMVEAGMNMVRIGGSMSYEGDAFYKLCDELGLMVWQDFAFSNFDYPAADPAFCASVMEEARQFLQRTQASPSLTVLCGASEVAQQAAMMGLPAPVWTNAIFEGILAETARALRPDVPYVAHSPCGGAMPFVADQGISHYYGVSAHRRPVEEARRAGVRFSAESLGFANVPDKAPFVLEAGTPTIAHPNYTERFAHDAAASWAFEGVRNHYCAALYGVDVTALRRKDPERFLALSRATSAEIIEATYAEWRREGSPTRGALVWFLRDLAPGAGWGVIDSLNWPKAAYYGLLRACRPITVVLTDENLNGLKVTLINETVSPRVVTLTLTCLRDGETPVMRATRDLTLEPRSTIGIAATDLWGGFFDTTYAFRFGEPSHDVTVGRLTDSSGAFVADAFHFPLGRGHAVADL
ncbi:glycoside hydrolase family 2 protein, partial [Beijerinckia sp. L45]|uniref:glycosyl hydrolase 2 galactose-binding domain-containing protein n=1 Tax=Beijerinckia sp. L45 TaxID=1641855 RepID=UPI001AEE2B4E